MNLKELISKKLAENFPGSQFKYSEYKNELSIKIDKKGLFEVSKFLKENEDLQFNYCSDITAVDWAKRKSRFTIVYNLFSFKNNFRLRLLSDVDENNPSIDSVTSVWGSANWQERETYDMYGIKFNNHPDLRRMYMPEEFEYHPLKKDFPLLGIPGSLPLPKK